MSLLVYYASRALEQMAEADQWSQANRPKFPDLFRKELIAALALISEYPTVGVSHPDRQQQGVKKRLLKKSGYYVYYRQDPKRPALEVLSIWSTKRGKPPEL